MEPSGWELVSTRGHHGRTNRSATGDNATLGLIQFAHDYQAGQEYHEGKFGGWNKLGDAGLALSSTLWESNDCGWPMAVGPRLRCLGRQCAELLVDNASLSLIQFAYDYNTGQWYSEGNYGGFQTLGNSGLSSAFMGDTSDHPLNNGFLFHYSPGTNRGFYYEDDQPYS